MLSKTEGWAIRYLCAQHSRLGEIDFRNIPFGSVFSDHMLTAEFREGRWNDPVIQPYGPISVSPSISGLHYGISVFEGMKAHKSPQGRPLLFRPRDNEKRFQRSAARLAMPPLPEGMFVEAVRALATLDQAWIPPAELGALYIRPILFSVDPSIRVKPAAECRFLVLAFPFGAYFTAPVDVTASEDYVRAFPGGTGDVKPAGNYAAGLLADKEAREAGFDGVMWLDATERRYVEECGVMNVFFVFKNRIVTPPLSGTILPGITRDSVITILRDLGYEVEETRIAMEEVFHAFARGELLECFGTGTAATLSHIRRIRYREQTIDLPAIEQRKVGPAARAKLLAIMSGREADPYGWLESL